MVGMASAPYLVSLSGERSCSCYNGEYTEGCSHSGTQQTLIEPLLGMGIQGCKENK